MPNAARSQPLPWCLPTIAVGLLFWLTHPGYLSFDSAVAFWSARHDRYVDISGILLPRLWHEALVVGENTTGIRILLAMMLGIGFGWLGSRLWRHATTTSRWVAAICLPLCPVFLIIAPHLWSDVLLVACLLLASAAAASMNQANRTTTRATLLMLLLVFSIAAALTRHNAIVALPPLLWWGLSALIDGRWRRLIGTSLILTLVMLISGTIRTHTVVTRLDTWAVTPLHDLQAVSIATRADDETTLIPKLLAGPGLTVGELRAAWHPYSATRLFAGTQSGVTDPTVAPLTKEQAAALRSAWIKVLREPSYWQHRWRLSQGLFGTYRDPVLRGQAESPGQATIADNPVLAAPDRGATRWWRYVIDALFRIGAASPMLYLALAATSMLVWRPPIASVALMASAIMYAAPYVVVAPSAELRYLLWPCVAAWIVMCTGMSMRAGITGIHRNQSSASIVPRQDTSPHRHDQRDRSTVLMGWTIPSA